MSTKLYVGGIPYSTTEAALGELFAKAGNVVSTSIIIDRMTGRSKGFGFVEMASEDEANSAINMYNGNEFEGRKLTVNVARPLEPRAPRDRRPM
jgi:RNA recognition motif-containing protein